MINGENLRIMTIILGSWNKVVNYCGGYPKSVMIYFVFIILLGLIPSTGLAEPEQLKPIRGIAFIEEVLGGNNLLIDEYRYSITPSTRFYAQNGTTSERNKFVEGMLVDFVADEHGNLLSLREEYDIEGEFKRNKPTMNLEPSFYSKKNNSIIERKKPTSFRKENGVWKN